MKVLRVIASMNPTFGGPCQGIRNSIPELNKLGIHSEVVSLDNPNDAFLNKDDFKIYALGEGKGPWKVNTKLLKWLDENINNYDCIIVHGLWQYYSYAVQKVFSKRSANNDKLPKLFVMPHGMLDPWFQKAKGREIKAIRNWLYWKLIENKLISNADALFFTCEEELYLARETFTPYSPKKEINVGYGILPPPSYSEEMKQLFYSKCENLLPNDRFILFLSRIDQKKGVDILIKAYKELYDKSDNKEVIPKLVIAGPGLETTYGNKVRELASDLYDLGLIIFPGMLNGLEKWGAFYLCEAFILPSHQENFGISVVEALACQKPVLISNQVNIYKEIVGNRAGIANSDDLSGTLSTLKEWVYMNKTDKVSMSINALKTYQTYFSIKEAAANLKKALLS